MAQCGSNLGPAFELGFTNGVTRHRDGPAWALAARPVGGVCWAAAPENIKRVLNALLTQGNGGAIHGVLPLAGHHGVTQARECFAELVSLLWVNGRERVLDAFLGHRHFLRPKDTLPGLIELVQVVDNGPFLFGYCFQFAGVGDSKGVVFALQNDK